MEDLYSLEKLQGWLEEIGEKPFRARQIFSWIFEKKVLEISQMTNLSFPLREKLASRFAFPLLELVETQKAKDGETEKFLWKLSDKKLVESVLISSKERRTVCVSSQVGCPARCAFCASGKEGLLRNLSVGEIVEQVVRIDKKLEEKGERVSHIVFMGMGEPLENYENVLEAARLFSEKGLGISQRRITISTVGVVEGINRLVEEEMKVSVVLSLHAPNQHIRKKIVPYARKYPLEDVLSAMDQYVEKTKRDTTFEYVLLEGINDQKEHAEELAKLLQGRRCIVNLIPYNPVEGLHLRRPKTEQIDLFHATLEKNGVRTTQRYTKGKDIAAACGQLALKREAPTVKPVQIGAK